MNRRTVISWLNLALLLLVATALASVSVVAQQVGRLSGTLTDPQGVAVPNNVVELRWNEVGAAEYRHRRRAKKHITTSTDSAGKFSLSVYRATTMCSCIVTGLRPYALSSLLTLQRQKALTFASLHSQLKG